MKAELDERERQHQARREAEMARVGLLPQNATMSSTSGGADETRVKVEVSVDDIDDAGPTSGEGANSFGDGNGTKTLRDVDLSRFNDSDDELGSDSDSDSDNDGKGKGRGSDDDDDDSDSDDEDALLMRELERIRKEREEEKRRKEEEEKQKAETIAAEAAMNFNPLLAEMEGNASVPLKRRWDDGVVFRNQAKDERVVKKRFTNNIVHSDFHRAFMNKYFK